MNTLHDRKGRLTHAKESLTDAIAALVDAKGRGDYRKLLDDDGNFLMSTRTVEAWIAVRTPSQSNRWGVEVGDEMVACNLSEGVARLLVTLHEALISVSKSVAVVAVKELDWREEPIPPAWECLASTAVGLYCIPLGRDLFVLRFRDKDTLGEFDTLEAAKAAAQADYEARILSALTPPNARADGDGN
ncbi:MAG: hypothetical protein EOR57_31380 [Mesorhizobium sp.]|uniref:hypothetical protein n=1 Tax=Mesorhizobium sp. TaxID=1871066 RepID=UPI000FE4856C|nr:hypothetical protein [Mesorhizobium sp.]RWL14849.1 MAG: hypothetical protein EOR57_31380 [Mesorhizobium sp.]